MLDDLITDIAAHELSDEAAARATYGRLMRKAAAAGRLPDAEAEALRTAARRINAGPELMRQHAAALKQHAELTARVADLPKLRAQEKRQDDEWRAYDERTRPILEEHERRRVAYLEANGRVASLIHDLTINAERYLATVEQDNPLLFGAPDRLPPFDLIGLQLNALIMDAEQAVLTWPNARWHGREAWDMHAEAMVERRAAYLARCGLTPSQVARQLAVDRPAIVARAKGGAPSGAYVGDMIPAPAAAATPPTPHEEPESTPGNAR